MRSRCTATLAIGGLAWLLLLPNAAYVITELNFSHRRADDDVPLWFDIVAVLALALSGVMNALLNVFFAQLIFIVMWGAEGREAFAAPGSWIAAGTILLLSTFGIYLGRYLRFNTWDIANPLRFTRKLVGHFAQPGRTLEALGFCATHTLLLVILYGIVIVPTVLTI